ncbi:MAG: hypothetical protein ACRC30_05800 [Clostridium sp.]
MRKYKFPLIPTVISIGIILAIISVIAYYFIYQDSMVVTAVNNSKTALENGQLQTAISDLSNAPTKTYADNELVASQEVAIENFKNISNQYNEAISDMNNSNYPECISILKSLHTNNKYLTERITNALSISNTGYAQLLYKEGIDALQAENNQSASSYYNTLSSQYPNSPFTKQLEAYLNGTAKGTIHSLNIEISRPMISPIGASPTPLSQTDGVIISPAQNATPSTVSNESQNLVNSNSENQNNQQQNNNTNNTTISNTQNTSNSNSNSVNQTPETVQKPTVSINPSSQDSNSNQTSNSSSNTTPLEHTSSKDSATKVSQSSAEPSKTATVKTKETQNN